VPPNLPHAIIVLSTHEARTFYRLACRDVHLSKFFDEWSYDLAKKKAGGTVKAYAYAVKRFINYFLEAEDQLNGSLSDLDLYLLLENYESYLAFGTDSDIELIQAIARAVPPGDKGRQGLGGSTIEQAIAGLNNFLTASESFRIALLQLQEAGHISGVNVANKGLIKHLAKVESSSFVKNAVRESSWLAGCLKGGMKTIKQAHLKPKSKSSDLIFADEFGGDEKTFPFDLAKELINSATNLRDKLLWSLIAASGIRISEAQTMLEEDVVIQRSTKDGKLQKNRLITSKKVFVIDPNTRRSKLKGYLTETEINQLPHKGREHPDTYLIEPFASLFWKYHSEYKADENRKEKRRRTRTRHPFLFKTVDTGDPVTHSYQTLYDSFSKAAIALTKKSYGFHALRHMYGFYTHNFAPMPNGSFGLPLKQVQLLLGHASLKTTQRYARQDSMKLEVAIGALNIEQSRDQFFSIDKQRLAYLEQQVAEIKARIEKRNSGELEND
jgi:integrase